MSIAFLAARNWFSSSYNFFEKGNLLLNYVVGTIDWEDWIGTPETKRVFVGWKVDGKKVLAQLKLCVSPKDIE